MDRIRTATATATGLLLSAAVLAPSPALAEQGGDGARSTQQPVVVVMDYSESMLAADADEKGTTRIDAAKAATRDLVEKTPEGAQLGMVAFGHADRNTCTKTETLQEVGEVDKDALLEKVDALQARGGTPIGQSLRQAAEELEDVEGEKSIILVSDGEPTCDQPPACEVAEQIAEEGIDLTVHTIGFRLQGNAAARQTLECIADATDGTYSDAGDADQLRQQLTVQATRAFEGYAAAGTPVVGGRSAAEAPTLLPGQYLDTIGAATRQGRGSRLGEIEQLAAETSNDDVARVRFYRIPVHEGYTPVVSATVVQSLEQERNFDFTRLWMRPVAHPGAEECLGRDFVTEYVNEDGRAGTRAPFNDPALTATWPDGPASEEVAPGGDCVDRDGMMTIAVASYSADGTDTEAPLEVAVAYRPQASEDGDLQEASIEPPMPGPATATPGGSSYNEATTLTPGQTISDDILPGERRYFAVDLEAGQELGYSLGLAGGQLDRGDQMHLRAFNPIRQSLDLSGVGATSARKFDSLTMNGGTASGRLTHRVLPQHASHSQQEGAASVPGRHYLMVTRDAYEDSSETSATFTLTVDVAGEPIEQPTPWITTAAQYSAAFEEQVEPSEQSPDDAAEGDSGAGPDQDGGTAEDAEQPEDVEQAEEAGDPEAAEAEQTAEADNGSVLLWVLGGAGLLLLAAGGVLMAARRSS